MNSTTATIYDALANLQLVDPHTHINPHAPASDTLADLLGYHYYTELAHSAGMPKSQIEDTEITGGRDPRELVRRLVENLDPLDNTAQYRWLVEICRRFFDFEGDRLDASNWETVYETAESKMGSAQWAHTVLEKSNVEAVFLTNDFDDDLEGFDTNTYIPCLRTDDLVFHLAKNETRERLSGCTGIELDGSLGSLRRSLEQRFEHFTRAGARACAISLPPSFSPGTVSDGRASMALEQVLRHGTAADASHQEALSRRVFWTLAELCDSYGLPFDLMIGVNRGVYRGGVYQGQDLYDSRVSLIQYKELFNAFPDVKFPVSVLASVTNQELVSYAWIFPNVITNGHWWYSNTPSFIARDAAARLEAVPRTKQIGYYSDAYKLEFVWPKFDMYKRILAGILSDHFVTASGWSEERAIDLGKQILRDNVDTIFPKVAPPTLLESPATVMEVAGEETPASQPTDTPEPATTILDGVGGVVAGSDAIAGVAIEILPDEDDEDGDVDSSAKTVMMEPESPSFETLGLDDLDPTPSQEELGDPGDLGAAMEPLDADAIEAQIDGDPLPFDSLDDLVDSGPDDSSDLPQESVDGADDEVLELDQVPELDQVLELDDADVLDDEIPTDDADDLAGLDISPEIEMLQGESPFQPDSENLQLKPDPLTGEWTFPAGQDEEKDSEDGPRDGNA